MTVDSSPSGAKPPPNVIVEIDEGRSVASYERELTRIRRTEGGLRAALAREEALLRQRDELILQQSLMSQESDHRLLNGLQMIVSLLSLQGRTTENAEVAAQLAAAADRVATIGRIHARLHSFDGAQKFAIRQYLEDLGGDFSTMHPARSVVVEGVEITVPASTAIPLGFIANELITNAVKYGTGRITISLEQSSEKTYAWSVSNEGRGLPAGFDPASSQKLGMRIIMSLTKQIGGNLHIGADKNQGARFTVLFTP